MPGQWHLNNLKPTLICYCFRHWHDQALIVYYFDTDIVISKRWETFTRWVSYGVVLTLDIADSHMSPCHVYRHAWRELAAKRGYNCRSFTGYVNGGCIGLHRRYASFANIWSDLMQALEEAGADMSRMKDFDGRIEFSRMDQDVLNATIMSTDVPVALLGYEAMGMFPWVGQVMPHAMFHRKPWARNYLADALRGFPPGRAHLAFWEFVDGPIRSFGSLELIYRRLIVKVARVAGLLHSRSLRDA